MTTRLIPHRFEFSTRSGSPRPSSITFDSDKEILDAQALLTGYRIGFDNGDHAFGQLEARLETKIVDTYKIDVSATLALRDYSDEWDDPYSGFIECVVVLSTL